MFQYHCLKKKKKKGLSLFGEEYGKTEEWKNRGSKGL